MNARRFGIIMLGVLIVLIGIVIFFSTRTRSPRQDPEVATQKLVDYTPTDTKMRLVIEGEVEAREEHRAIRITVGNNERIIEILTGYQGTVLSQQTLGNDQDAYYAFLAGLENSQFTRANRTRDEIIPAGACPLGIRYRYEIIENGTVKQSLWNTSCGRMGSFAGNSSTVRSLFQRQIPGYRDFTQGLNL